MRKATLVLATSVAFLVSGAAFAATGTRTATPTSASDLFKGGTITDASGNLRVESKPISGVYIPAGASASTEVAVPVKTAAKVVKSAVGTAVKAAVRANAAAAVASAAINAAVDAAGWVIDQSGQPVKKNPNGGEASCTSPDCYYWESDRAAPTSQGTVILRGSNPSSLCSSINWEYGYQQNGMSYESQTVFRCNAKRPEDGYTSFVTLRRNGSTCGPGGTYQAGSGICTVAGTSALTEQDYNDLGDWVQQQDGTYVRQVAIDSCSLAAMPEACFETLIQDKTITGPALVTGTPSTSTTITTTTKPDGTTEYGTSTTTTTPAATVTYNNKTTNNITYNTYNKTSTTNPDGSTTETTSDEGAPPNVPDLTSTAFGPLDGLPADIIDTGAKGSSLPFFSWFSMGGQCKEHTFQLPVVGALTTSYCPIHEAYVRPFLYFMFSVWTFIYCFQIWRESTVRVRIM